jgi:tRNA pseudouridine55 synthase
VKYGILNLFKPIGPTSRDCVNKLVKLFRPSKVAHAGTLDPLAQGVLVILVGPAVRLMDEIHELDKEYVAGFHLGQRSPSGDLETACEPVPVGMQVNRNSIHDAMRKFLGPTVQTPSSYSAIRVNGKRAHRSARLGTDVQMPPRTIMIHELELLACDPPRIRLRIRCSTGTYIRTLGSDLAKSLGTDAVMTELTRIRVGPFGIESSLPLDMVQAHFSDAFLEPPISALQDWEQWSVDDVVMRRILDGQRLAAEEVLPTSHNRIAVLDSRKILRAVLKRLPDGTWRCDKGIAHWDILP